MVYSAGTGGWHVGNLADRQMRAAAQRRGIQMPILARHPCHCPLPSAAHPSLRHRNLGSDDPGAAFYRLQRSTGCSGDALQLAFHARGVSSFQVNRRSDDGLTWWFQATFNVGVLDPMATAER